jgi:hypothetical protein
VEVQKHESVTTPKAPLGGNSAQATPRSKEEWIAALKEMASSANRASRTSNAKRRVAKYKYKLSLISYLDILGMKDLLRDSGNDANRVGKIIELSRSFSQPDKEDAAIWKWRFANFSDLILRAVPILSDANKETPVGLVFHELQDLCYLQANLLARGILIRGAVTIGYISMNRGLIFGQGLADAYKLESKHARYPRIIIDKIVLDFMRVSPFLRGPGHTYGQEIGFLKNTIRRDGDDMWFLDYLRYMLHNADNNHQYCQFVASHRAFIETQVNELKALDQRKREVKSRADKLRWLGRFHNQHVDTIRSKRLKAEMGWSKQSLYV